ncbi:hypothetical protein RAS1_10650 [Phycisphaerae bacterium RAS1]|nr:hypothetical protein RAS1_10650 [Phycisphaerae bacterium RAS1]
MKSHNHYESAFEDFLRMRQVAYVAVDEAKKSIFRDARLKSFDFIVYSEGPFNWLVDIKGRRWATRRGAGKPAWENWVTLADLEGLEQWQGVFGSGFRGLLVFAYWIDKSLPAAPREIVHAFREQNYVFVGVPLDEYRTEARVRSPKWETYNLPAQSFARHARPMAEWLAK